MRALGGKPVLQLQIGIRALPCSTMDVIADSKSRFKLSEHSSAYPSKRLRDMAVVVTSLVCDMNQRR